MMLIRGRRSRGREEELTWLKERGFLRKRGGQKEGGGKDGEGGKRQGKGNELKKAIAMRFYNTVHVKIAR